MSIIYRASLTRNLTAAEVDSNFYQLDTGKVSTTNYRGLVGGVNPANLFPDPSGELGGVGWTGFVAGTGASAPNLAPFRGAHAEGLFYRLKAALTGAAQYITDVSDKFPISAGDNVILSAELFVISGATGSYYVQPQFFDSNGNTVGYGNALFATANGTWAFLTQASGVPANTVYMSVRIVADNTPVCSAGGFNVRRIQVNNYNAGGPALFSLETTARRLYETKLENTNPTVTGGLTASNFLAQSAAPDLTTNDTVGTGQSSFTMKSQGSTVWQMIGRSLGVDGLFGIARYVNNAYVDIPFSINHNTGAAYFTQRPTWASYTPWDSGNFDPTTKFDKVGGTISGATNFNVRPTFNGSTPWDSANFNPATKYNQAGGAIGGNVSIAGTLSVAGATTLIKKGDTTVRTVDLQPEGTAQGLESKLGMFGTFTGTSDNVPRLVGTLNAGFNGGNWGAEYIRIRINVAANDAGSDANIGTVTEYNKNGVYFSRSTVSLASAQPNMNIDCQQSDNGDYGYMYWRRKGVAYWAWYMDASNSFGLARFNASGYLDTPIQVVAGTGAVSVNKPLTVSSDVKANRYLSSLTAAPNDVTQIGYLLTTGITSEFQLPTNAFTGVTVFTLPAGVWDVVGWVHIGMNDASTTTNNVLVGLTTANSTAPAQGDYVQYYYQPASCSGGAYLTPVKRFVVPAGQTQDVYLIAYSNLSAGTIQRVYGKLEARKVA